MTQILESPVPIVAAPMAGGITTVALARAVAKAGAFPFLAGGYKTPDALVSEIRQLRVDVECFGVNLFVPSCDAVDREAVLAYAAALAPEADVYGLDLNPSWTSDDDGWGEKLAFLLKHPVPVVSFVFGLPEPTEIAALQEKGTRVLATVTSVDEAQLAKEAGVDGLVVQGPDAGGHSATFDARRTPEPIVTTESVRRILQHVELPVIAAGGVDGPEAVRRLLDSGAQGVAVGTLLVRTDEAGGSATYKQALTNPDFTETVITRTFTGRPARALRNGFIDRHEHAAPTAYPAVHHLTLPLRLAAGKAGDPDRTHLWAGTGYRKAQPGPAASVIRHLAQDL